MTTVDLLVAVRNEEATIPWFIDAVRNLPVPADVELRMIFVEDSSQDRTREVLASAVDDPRITAFTLHKGAGQGAAIHFAATRSDADAVIMMDVDGSHPINAIVSMIEAFQKGAAVVQCRRTFFLGRTRGRALGSAAFGFVWHLLTGFDFNRQNVYFRLVRRDAKAYMLKHPHWWRFLRIQPSAAWPGPYTELPLLISERAAGMSKYSVVRLIGLAVDGILSMMSARRLAVWLAVATGTILVIFRFGPSYAWMVPTCMSAFACWRVVTLRRAVILNRLSGDRITPCAPAGRTSVESAI